MIRTVILTAILLVCTIVNAEARQRHRVPGAERSCIPTSDIMRPCQYTPNFLAGVRSINVTMKRTAKPKRERVAKADWRARIRQNVVPLPKPRQIETASHGAAVPLEWAIKRVASQVVSHPAGCPSRAFCGCGAAVRVFGSPVRSLWLAANWLRFPRTAPAPGMVAARRGHVFVLEQDLGGGKWQVYDANSGGRKTRIHPRSLAGYTVVNPHASRYASAS